MIRLRKIPSQRTDTGYEIIVTLQHSDVEKLMTSLVQQLTRTFGSGLAELTVVDEELVHYSVFVGIEAAKETE